MSLYIFKDGQQLGPYEDDAVLQSLRTGAFAPGDLSSRDGQGDWRPLSFYFPLPEHQVSEAKTEIFQTGQTEGRQTDPFLNYQPPPAAPMAQYQPPMMPAAGFNNPNEKSNQSMSVASWGLGIAGMSIMLIGLVPCLGWLNYFNFPLSIGAIITGAIVMSQTTDEKVRSKAQLGLILGAIALVIGGGRLLLGGCVL